MSDLGLLLRKAREQRGLTLDDIQEATKIRKRYLDAIETGDYKVLPGSFYVRAFVKTYAETVGLDAEEVLRLYHKELPQAPSPETVASEPMLKPRSRSVQHNDKWGKLAVNSVLWLFPLLIAALLYFYLVQNPGDDAEERDNSTDITSETTLPSSPPASPTSSAGGSPTGEPEGSPSVAPSSSPSPETALTLTKQSGTTSYYDVSSSGTPVITITLSGTSWVGVQENNSKGKYVYNGTPKTDEKLTFDLTGPLYVNVAHAVNASITIDGVAVDDEEASGSRKFVFTPAAGETAGEE
ncbi:helix-turn-helix domain-containing protein [Cohnella algarum]|uniref:helix-turn-helix domain-containing protein n=1 Tax=Cohnella algarum TaxID=2044859 RepID=UPI001966FF9C|nr:RodZ domain-containing protein [Cohnella algarum]MBN2984246.1 helix-turn-helix domain-containing protein [Cohnella algarum]